MIVVTVDPADHAAAEDIRRVVEYLESAPDQISNWTDSPVLRCKLRGCVLAYALELPDAGLWLVTRRVLDPDPDGTARLSGRGLDKWEHPEAVLAFTRTGPYIDATQANAIPAGGAWAACNHGDPVRVVLDRRVPITTDV